MRMTAIRVVAMSNMLFNAGSSNMCAGDDPAARQAAAALVQIWFCNWMETASSAAAGMSGSFRWVSSRESRY